eukprot:scaffold1239_cov175-Pinguiococcus_pyrenoidosus.AAC.42
MSTSMKDLVMINPHKHLGTHPNKHKQDTKSTRKAPMRNTLYPMRAVCHARLLCAIGVVVAHFVHDSRRSLEHFAELVASGPAKKIVRFRVIVLSGRYISSHAGDIPSLGYVVRLSEELRQLVFLVERRHQLVLQLGLALVHQEAHDRLGHQIHVVLAHNVEVRAEQRLDDLRLDAFAVGRRVLGARHGIRHLLQLDHWTLLASGCARSGLPYYTCRNTMNGCRRHAGRKGTIRTIVGGIRTEDQAHDASRGLRRVRRRAARQGLAVATRLGILEGPIGTDLALDFPRQQPRWKGKGKASEATLETPHLALRVLLGVVLPHRVRAIRLVAMEILRHLHRRRGRRELTDVFLQDQRAKPS